MAYYDDDIEVTPREILFGVIIVLVMLIIGIGVYSGIEKSMDDANKEVLQAVHIDDADIFAHCIDTSVGRAFVEGTAYSDAPLSCNHVPDKQFLEVKVVHEEYDWHYETYEDDEGEEHTRTVWEWEYRGEDRNSVDNVMFLGQTMPYSGFRGGVGMRGYGTFSTGYHKRDIVHGVENGIYGTIYSNLVDSKIDVTRFYSGCNIDNAVFKYTDHRWVPIVYWLCWLIITAALVFGFVMLKNKWLH